MKPLEAGVMFAFGYALLFSVSKPRLKHAVLIVMMWALLPARGMAQIDTVADVNASKPPRFLLLGMAEFARFDAGAKLRTDSRRELNGFGVGLRVAHRPIRLVAFGGDVALALSSLGGVSDLRVSNASWGRGGDSPDLAISDINVRGWTSIPLFSSLRGEFSAGMTIRASERLGTDGLVDRRAITPSFGVAVSRPLPWYRMVVALGVERLLEDDHGAVDTLGAVAAPRAIRGSGSRGYLRLSVPLERGEWMNTARTRSGPPVDSGAERLARPMLEFTIENDTPTSDRDYTNGVRLQLHEVPTLHRVANLVGLDKPACLNLPLASNDSSRTCIRSSVAVHQTMYTPTAQYADTVQLADRPFAGLLFGATRWELVHREYRDSTARTRWFSGDAAFSIESQLGVMGPMAQARETQRMAHWAVAAGAQRPNGWGYQTRNRPYVQALAEAWVRPSLLNGAWLRDRCGSSGACNVLRALDGADAALDIGLTAGTVFHRASVGMQARWAHNRYRLPGSAFIRPIGPAVMYQLATKVDAERQPLASGPSDAEASEISSVTSSPRVLQPRPAPRIRYAVTGALLHRATLRNETITGGHHRGAGAAATGPVRMAELELTSGFGEARFGGELEIMRGRVGLQLIWRGREFRSIAADAPVGTNRYATLSFGWVL